MRILEKGMFRIYIKYAQQTYQIYGQQHENNSLSSERSQYIISTVVNSTPDIRFIFELSLMCLPKRFSFFFPNEIGISLFLSETIDRIGYVCFSFRKYNYELAQSLFAVKPSR